MRYSDAARELEAVAFSLLRLLEHSCAWIINSPSFEQKMMLGDIVGAIGAATACVATAHHRLSLEPLTPSSTAEEETEFERATQLHTGEVMSGFVPTKLGDIVRRLDVLLMKMRCSSLAVLHQPTIEALTVSRLRLNGVVSAPEPLKFRPPAGATVLYNHSLPVPAVGVAPARPSSITRSASKFLPAPPEELLKTSEGALSLLFFFFIDIEIAAAEVCAGNVVLFRDSPLEFKCDMARQVWDESRHARMVQQRIRTLGGDIDGGSFTQVVWDRWWLAKTLAEKIAVEQIIQEGNGVDASPGLADAFRASGDHDSADMIEAFMMDECLHAGFGNKWMLELTGASLDAYREAVYQASALIQVDVPGRSPVHELARLHAGFPLEIVREFSARRAKITG